MTEFLPSRCLSGRKLLAVCVFGTIFLYLIFVIKIGRTGPTNVNFPEIKAVVCSIQIKEEAYIDEWVDYHLAIGFTKIYIYDNSENFDLKKWGNQRFRDNVRVKHFPGKVKQIPAYMDCAKLAEKNGETWAAFFDIDEFLLLKKHANINDFLMEYGPYKGALGINWVLVGTSNATKYEPKPVTLRFQQVLPKAYPNIHIKPIARVRGLKSFIGLPHNVLYDDKNAKTIDTNGAIIEGPFNRNLTMDIAVLYHYIYKSREEYVSKRERGRPDNDDKQDYDNLLSSAKNDPLPVGDTFDDSIWQILKNRVPKYDLLKDIGMKQRLSVYLRMFMQYF